MKHCANKSNLAIVRDYLNGERPFIQVGYRAEDKYIIRKEGEEWTDINGKQWKETKTGPVSINTPVLDMVRETYKCTKCGKDTWIGGDRLDTKMVRKTGKCFDCLIEEETQLKISGLFHYYEKVKLTRNKLAYLVVFKNKLKEAYDYAKKEKKITYIHSSGEEEVWTNEGHAELLQNIRKDYKQCCKDIFYTEKEYANAVTDLEKAKHEKEAKNKQ